MDNEGATSTPPPPAPGGATCWNCGTVNPAERDFCTKCATELPKVGDEGGEAAVGESLYYRPVERRRNNSVMAASVIALAIVGLLGVFLAFNLLDGSNGTRVADASPTADSETTDGKAATDDPDQGDPSDGSDPLDSQSQISDDDPWATSPPDADSEQQRPDSDEQSQNEDSPPPDLTPPVLGLPVSFEVVDVDLSQDEVVNYPVSVTDIVDPDPTVECKPDSGSTFTVGPTTVVCTASDAAGNSISGKFVVTVTEPEGDPPATDVTDPQLVLPTAGFVVVDVDGSKDEVVDFDADVSATDDSGVNPTVECTPPSGYAFPVNRSTTVTCTASDAAGNSVSGKFDVTVDPDVQSPELKLPGNFVVVDVDGSKDEVVDFDDDVSATDDWDLDPLVECTPPSGYAFPVNETTTVTCTASDAAGNSVIDSFDVTVDPDVQSPELKLPGNFVVVDVDGSKDEVVDFDDDVSATDDWDLDPLVECTPPSGYAFPVNETTTVTCTASDAAGNPPDIDSFDVTVDPDVQSPELKLPGNFVVVDVDGSKDEVVDFDDDVSATDDWDLDPLVECTPPSGYAFPVNETTTVTCTASDAAGNPPDIDSFDVTVTPPEKEDTPPEKEDTPPEKEDTPPEKEDTPPVVEDTPPVVEDTPPVVEDTPPVVEDTPPVVEDTPPVVEDTPPVVEDTPPVVEDTPPVVEDTPPVVEDTPPVVEDTPPVVEDTPPVVEDTPPVVEDTPPVVEDTPPVVEDTPPVVEDTPPVVEDTTEPETSNETLPKPKTTPPPHPKATQPPKANDSRPLLTRMLERVQPPPCEEWTAADDRNLISVPADRPLSNGARKAVWCGPRGRYVQQLAVFSFRTEAKLDEYFSGKMARENISRVNEACDGSRQGHTTWAHGRIACYIDGGRAKIRWTDRRSDVYGILDAQTGQSLTDLKDWWNRKQVKAWAEPL